MVLGTESSLKGHTLSGLIAQVEISLDKGCSVLVQFAEQSLVMGCYILVDSERKYQGLEEVMVENMIEIARKLEFEGILFDVYRTETKFVALLLDMGFKVTGSLPECGYMKDAGYVDSLLLYKEFTVGSSKL